MFVATINHPDSDGVCNYCRDRKQSLTVGNPRLGRRVMSMGSFLAIQYRGN